ncbi:2-hydroxymuconate-semialdehyde hydrolase/2-hydroxy-6-oxo-octa-2,4-dienoate hydrolase [Nocardioides alpinus]|uniref:2-hydroxymuconate-semialdehyde hydrolase/2-hydroxy-6-oxo-octa-2,4-dienoate hydrolase n=1 Tax=Nocardioides alpinus TaxID=748909 RepID=A0A1I0V6W5_9ACTN|nr:alpha/beta hydrolase [Nocardioides alpinus]PKH37100.1 alpha/beta hydrolase [Nocardioides alpinus]SFA72104.1 2-hydroxymuconate-semialdehyde hydrolase/2-hydroxy-6-oxo-octa-2,4-dienoate hydrolase [Nocardioides alpinus]
MSTPVVLFLHGSGPGTTGAGAWGATIEGLGPDWHAVAPDQAGFGHSPLPPGSRGGLQLWVDEAAALMDSLGVSSYAVVGHSMGGAVALALAAARPQQVARVVAVGTMGAPGAPLSPDLDALWAAPPGPDGARDMLGRLFHDQSLVTEAAVQARAAAMEAGAASFADMFPAPRQRWSDDLTLSAQTLAAVRAPVLLVHGAQDRVTPVQTSSLPLMDHLGDVDLHVLGRCGHAPAVERPRAFQHLLSGFLRDQPGI